MVWRFPELRRYFSEQPWATTGAIEFWEQDEPSPHTGLPLQAPLALDDVPPVAFSEAMRDADLVVSVASANETEPSYSAAIVVARKAVIGEITRKMDLEGVDFDDRYVYVNGQRARYRIHMGSGSIHVIPGGHIGVLPEPQGDRELPYLPFSDTDHKTSEILSKMILLNQDDRITDRDIKSQIDAVVGR